MSTKSLHVTDSLRVQNFFCSRQDFIFKYRLFCFAVNAMAAIQGFLSLSAIFKYIFLWISFSLLEAGNCSLISGLVHLA